MNKRVKSRILHISHIFVYILLSILISTLGRKFTIFHIGDSVLEVGRILSLLTVIQIMLTIYITIRWQKAGFISVIVLYLVSIFNAFMLILRSRNLSSIPGIFMNIAGIIIVSIIFNYSVRLNRIANTDILTKLNNRRMLTDIVEEKICKKKRFAFVLIDLDDFKRINDLMGHDQGDLFLCQFAEKWKKIAEHEHAFFARIGGDEFVMIKETDEDKEELSERIRNTILLGKNQSHNTYQIQDEEFVVSASIGISFFPEDGLTYTDLYRYADIAMYQVKNHGKEDVAIYRPDFLSSVNRDYVVEQHIRTALQDEDLFVVFQPQYASDSMKLTGAEALVRMMGKDEKVYYPGKFIPVAEKSNLIIEIDFFVFKSALENFLPFVKKNPSLVLSVNLSVKTMFSDGFLSRIDKIMEEAGYPPENLQVEVTESLMISPQGKKNAKERLNHLHERGMKLAIDDFGTGYSSLSYLRDLPFDTLKIDKAFVDTLSENEEDNAFVKAIITIGHILHMKVVSEGVETKVQMNVLKENNCDILQGYFCGRPMTLEQFSSSQSI